MIRALDALRKWKPLRDFEVFGVHYEDTRPKKAYLGIRATWNGPVPRKVRNALMRAVIAGQTRGVDEEAQGVMPFLELVEQRIKRRLGKGYVVNVTGLTGHRASVPDWLSDAGILSSRLKLRILIQPPGTILRQHKGLRERGIIFEQTED